MATCSSPESFQIVRYLSCKNHRAWQARRLARKSLNGDERWRYISVRRLCSCEELEVTKLTQAAVAAPNNQPIWEDTRSAIESYLCALWRRGGLAGISSDKAIFSHIGFDNAIAEVGKSQETVIAQAGILPDFLILLWHLTLDVD